MVPAGPRCDPHGRSSAAHVVQPLTNPVTLIATGRTVRVAAIPAVPLANLVFGEGWKLRLLSGLIAMLMAAVLFLTQAPQGLLGLAFIILGLLYIPVLKNLPISLRSVINALFVVGFPLTLMVVDGVGNMEIALITIGFFVFWMYTRIQLSQWGHSKICDGCDEPCPARE